MKKKMLFMAALAGAVTLASCVKDDESASVTAVRNAKAAQLNGEAAASNAQATLYAAQAVRQQANAAYVNAQTEYEKALAAEKAAQAAQEEYKADHAKAQLEAQLVQAQQQLLQAQQQLATQLQNQDAQILANLFDNYSDLQNQILDKKAELLGVKYDLETTKLDNKYAQKAVEAGLIADKKQLALNNARLKVLKDSKYESMDKTEIRAKAEALHQQYDLEKTQLGESDEAKALIAASKALEAQVEEIQELNTLIVDLNRLKEEYVDTDGDGNPDSWQRVTLLEWAQTEWYKGFIAYEDANYYPVTDYYQFVGNTGYWYWDSNTDTWTWQNEDTQVVKGLRFIEVNKLNADRDVESWTEYTLEQIGKSTDTATTTNKYGALTAYAQVKAAEEQMTTAKAMPETTDAEKDAKKAAVEAAEDAVAAANDNIAMWQRQLDNQVSNQKRYKEAIAKLDVDAYNKTITKLLEDLEAYTELEDAWREAKNKIDEIDAQANLLDNIANNTVDVKQEIANYEQENENLEKNIAKAEANLTNITWINGYPTGYDAAIEYLEARIEAIENEITVLELEAATYLAQIAELAEDEAAEAAEEPATEAATEG